ncbi:MAG: FecR domain-containing protein [Polyangiales bacterium]
MNRQARIILAIAILVLLGAGIVIGLVVARTGVIAELASAHGSVQSQHGASSWQSAATPDRYRIGDAVRTGEASTARVRMRSGGGIELRPRTTVRFSAARPGTDTPAVRVEQGEVQLHAEAPLSISTGSGTVRVEAGGRVRLTAEGAVLRVSVELGRAVVERAGAPSTPLSEGANTELTNEGAAPEDAGRAPPETVVNARTDAEDTVDSASIAPDASASEEPAFDASTDDGATLDAPSNGSAHGVGTAFVTAPADLEVSLGDSASVHAPALPVRARIDLSARCASGGAQLSTSIRGALSETRAYGSVTVELPSGAHAIRARCDGSRSTFRTVLVVDSASGAAALPSRPATNDVELDGHNYTVLYQNLLPILRVRWPGAPSSSAGYSLTVRDGRGREINVEASAPVLTLSSGQVRDGTARLSMRAKSGGARSAETSVTVQFDNDANTAQIRAPRPGVALSGTIAIEGTALEGSTVTAGGHELALDSQRRFQGEVTMGADAALVIMIRHRTSGTHYYVRRALP